MAVTAPSAAVLLLIHRALGGATGLLASLGVAASVDFNHTITLGSVLIAFIIVAISGVFTVRSKIGTIWREDAEGQKAAKEHVQEELANERAERALFERQQQEIRHDLKAENAGLLAQLKAMEAKTDLTAALEAIRVMNADLSTAVATSIIDVIREWNRSSEDRDRQTQNLLTEIRDKLPSEPFDVHEVEPHLKG